MPNGTRITLVALVLGVFLTPPWLCAQFPAAPPPPARYKATLRYDIPAGRDLHVAQYDALIAHLKKLDFDFDPKLDKHAETDREDPNKNELTGFLPSKSLTRVFANPHAASILVV